MNSTTNSPRGGDATPARRNYSVRTWLTTTSFWSYMALSNPILFGGALALFAVTLPFDRRRALLHLYTCGWAYHYVRLLPLWHCHFYGVENIERGKTFVLVANHQSLGDILVLFGLFRHYKWVSKREIFRVPFIGWNMRLNNYVALKRGDAASIAQMLEACREHLRNGSSVMMFPEGTRSTDGEIKRFKHGAFTLAMEEQIDVIPIVIEGTRDALPKHGLMLEQQEPLQIDVRVLPPISPRDFHDVQELSEETRRRMTEELSLMRRARGIAGPGPMLNGNAGSQAPTL